jgi:hypothetical protein
MGYYVKGTGNVLISKENLAAAYDALMALQDAPDESKSGGAWSGGTYTQRWYSWMPADLRSLPDTKAVFDELGFDTVYQENGDLLIIAYDNKTGQEELFFAAAAPFITTNSEMYWEGEDGLLYKWEFVDGKMIWLDGYANYGNAREYDLDTGFRQWRSI